MMADTDSAPEFARLWRCPYHDMWVGTINGKAHYELCVRGDLEWIESLRRWPTIDIPTITMERP